MAKETSHTPKQVIESIERNVKLFDQGVEGHVGDEVVLVLGSTGAGKSTVMNILAGKKMEILEEKEKELLCIDVVDKSYAGEIKGKEGFVPMKIGHSTHSETQFPNYITVKHEGGSTQFWDCPGFGENRKSVIDISNMYYVNRILQHATASQRGGAKFVVIESNAGTHDGGKQFRDSIKTICKMFPTKDVRELVDATTFIFTKVPKNEEQGSEYLKDVIDRTMLETVTPENKRTVEFLQNMLDRLSEIKHIEIPKIDPQQTLQNLDYLTGPVKEIPQKVHSTSTITNCSLTIAVGPDSHQVVTDLQEHWQSEMNEKCHKLIPLVKEVYEQLVTHTSRPEALEIFRSFFTILRAQPEQMEHGRSTDLALALVQDLRKIPHSSSNDAYNKILNGIEGTLELIKFAGSILSNQACGAYFTNITNATRDGMGQFLDADTLAMIDLDTKRIEQWQFEMEAVWREKCLTIIMGTTCTVGAIACIASSAFVGPEMLPLALPFGKAALETFTKFGKIKCPERPLEQTAAYQQEQDIREELFTFYSTEQGQAQEASLIGEASYSHHIEEGNQ